MKRLSHKFEREGTSQVGREPREKFQLCTVSRFVLGLLNTSEPMHHGLTFQNRLQQRNERFWLHPSSRATWTGMKSIRAALLHLRLPPLPTSFVKSCASGNVSGPGFLLGLGLGLGLELNYYHCHMNARSLQETQELKMVPLNVYI